MITYVVKYLADMVHVYVNSWDWREEGSGGARNLPLEIDIYGFFFVKTQNCK